MGERRRDGRAALRDAYANKYIDGVPHMVQLLDVSESGIRIRRIFEPETTTESFPLELSIGGVRFWAWTRRVWTWGCWEALEIVAADPMDRARFRKLVRATLGA